jgi:Cd2+/Zn2+-exporting ATPase
MRYKGNYKGNLEEDEEKEKGKKRLFLTIVATAFLAIGIALAINGVGKGFVEILFVFALAFSIAPILWEAVKHFKMNPFNADLLMGIAGIGATAIGVWEEGAVVLILYNIAETIEDYIIDKTRKLAGKIAAILPKKALVKTNGTLEEMPVEKLQVGQVIVVKPGWRIPVDGRIIQGSSLVDQSMITGESIPVEKGPGDEILAGTLNIQGSLEVRVERPFYDSTVSRIVRIVTEERRRKAKIERFVDRFSRIFTPLMLIIATSVAFIPPLAFGESLSVWIYRALIVLVVACPSAFLIATPVTILMGLTRAMWSGFLIKGGKYLEELSRIRVVAFDKTGTLTLGKLKVSKIVPSNEFKSKEVLKLAAIAASRSSHPIALAIVNEAKEQGISLNEHVHVIEIAGKGVKATLQDGRTVLIGKPLFLEESGIKTNIENDPLNDGTHVAVALNNRFAGLIIVKDEPRQDAKETIEVLKTMNIEVAMITGDNEATAKVIAEQLGITNYYANLLPEDKVSVANNLREKYGPIATVGDGINDAPVLAASNVGIAIGTAGNDIAIEAADVALMGSDLRSVPYIIKLARKTMTKLKVNIALTLLVKFFMILLGILGLIPLWFAVIGDDGLTLVLIANSLTLLYFKK